MKRILILTFVLFTISNMSPVMAAYNETVVIAKLVLTHPDINIMNNIDQTVDVVTRAEVAVIASKMVKELPTRLYLRYGKTKNNPLNDVSEEHWAYQDINKLRISGVVCGDENQNFRPDEPCTYAEMIKIYLGVMGWYTLVEAQGDKYPDGYIQVAQDIGIHIPDVDINSAVTLDDAYYITYQALITKTLDEAYLNAYVNKIDFIDYPSLLERKHNIFQVRGYAEKLDSEHITIDGIEYQGQVNDEDFTSGFVVCFYKNDKENDVNIIVTCYPISELNFDNSQDKSQDKARQGDGSAVLATHRRI